MREYLKIFREVRNKLGKKISQISIDITNIERRSRTNMPVTSED